MPTVEERATLGRALEAIDSHNEYVLRLQGDLQKAPEVYSHILSEQGIPVSELYHRRKLRPEGNTCKTIGYDFVTFLVDPDEDTVIRAFRCEVDLERQFLSGDFDFSVRQRVLSFEQERDKLLADGFQLYKSE